jgi:predicted N-acetyltransferase YhbS
VEIRPERPSDFVVIRDLVVQVFREAFGSGLAEARLVEDVRATDAYLPALSLVALHNGTIVGYVMLSEVLIIAEGKTTAALALAPLGVLKPFRRQGIGATLVRQALEVAEQTGYRVVFVQGSPTYYGRFGFEPASSHGFTTPFSNVPDPDNMVLGLGNSTLSEVSGYVEYPKAWDAFK